MKQSQGINRQKLPPRRRGSFRATTGNKACAYCGCPEGILTVHVLDHDYYCECCLAFAQFERERQSQLTSEKVIQQLIPTEAQVLQCESSESIADLYRPWIERMTLAIEKRSGRIKGTEAFVLLTMINLALDVIEHACVDHRLRFADILALLYPIEDLLVALRLAFLAAGKDLDK